MGRNSAGTLGAAIIFVVYLFANYFDKAAPELYGVPAWQIALPIHIVAWILQVHAPASLRPLRFLITLTLPLLT